MAHSVLGPSRLAPTKGNKTGRINLAFWAKLILITAAMLLAAQWWMRAHSSRLVPPPPPSPLLTSSSLSRASLPHDEYGHVHRALLPPISDADLTIFTVHSPESDAHHGGHSLHLRAMYSWAMRVQSPKQVHVYVREFAHCAELSQIGVTCRVSACWDDDFNAPRLTCVIAEANARATTRLMLYVDDHLILFDDALPALARVAHKLQHHYLMVGRSHPLMLKLDDGLDLETWQRDLEAALFLDSSAEQGQDLLGQVTLEQRQIATESKSLHFLCYAREELDLSVLPPTLLMDGGAFLEHSWESALLASLLVQDSVHVVDVSASLTAIEFGHKDPSNHTAMMNERNFALSANFTGLSELHSSAKTTPWLSHLALGRLENAHYALTGRCPTCTIKENREADLPLILLRKSNAARQVIVIATNADYLSLTFNWICRAEALGIRNFVMLAEDRVAYRILRKMNVAVVLRKDAPYRKEAAAVGSKLFQETLYLRALFFQQVVSLGFSLIYTHLDTVWFLNPLDMLAQSDCDMFVQIEKEKSSGGLLTVKANAVGQAFAQDYLICEQENWAFIQVHGKPRFSFSDDVDIDCVELISTRLMRRNHLKRCVLDPLKYVTERDFFDRQQPQRRAVWPAFVHMNQAQGVSNKTAAFQGWHLWAVDDDAMVSIPRIADAHSHGELHCLKPTVPLPPPTEAQQEQVHIIIHVLCSTEAHGMELTLLSLAAASYDTDVLVDLTLTLQQPEHPSAANSQSYLRTHTLLQQFDWPHGTKTIIVLDAFVGPTDQWIDNWGLNADNQAFLMVMQAGQVIAPQWATFVRRALEHYYFDPFAFDPQLMAINLMHQINIVGESPSARFGSRIPSQLIAAAAAEDHAKLMAQSSSSSLPNATLSVPHLYLYQLVPLSGTLFFPRHFATFVQWYLAQNVSDARVPCIPTLISNQWWKQEPSANWWVWMQRFTFEAGWYALTTNFHTQATDKTAEADAAGAGAGARALLVDDQSTSGALLISLAKQLASSDLVFPPRSSLPLFDLHFHRFDLPAPMLSRRKLMFPPLPSSTSMARAAELEAAMHEQGDLVEQPNGLAALRPVALTGRLSADMRDDHLPSDVHDDSDESPELAEAEISHLDVMIESMIQEMEERSVGTAGGETTATSSESSALAGKPDLHTLRAAAASRSARRHSLLHTHRAHHRRAIRGVDSLDRCYVVSDAPAAEEASECKDCFRLHPTLRLAIDRRVALSKQQRESSIKAARKSAIEAHLPIPPPPPDVPDPLAVFLTTNVEAEELYNLMFDLARPRLPSADLPYDEKTSGAVRFLLYQPTKPAPFHGHLRGLYFSFLMSLLTNRILLIDLPDLDMQYECPFPNAHWSWRQMEPFLKDVRRDVLNHKEAAKMRTAGLDQLYSAPILVHNDVMAHDRVLFKNVMYKNAAATLFGSSSRMRRTGLIIKLLLSKPKAALVTAAADAKRALGFADAKATIAVHVVVPSAMMARPVSAADALPGVPGRHWDCIRSFLLSLDMRASDALIVFSSNRPSPFAFALARQELGRFGRVVTMSAAWNGNASTGGVSWSQTSSSLQVDPVTGAELIDPAIVGGFLFGDADVSISSGTTHGIFYSARTNFAHKALIVKLAKDAKKEQATTAEEDYCGPMHRLDLPMQEDITY